MGPDVMAPQYTEGDVSDEPAKIGCSPIPCGSCPYRRDVPSGVWSPEEYAKLPAYDAETFAQPAKLFMCHQQNNSLCTGWVQSHANRDHRFDLLALRFSRTIDDAEVSKVALSEPLVPLFRSGAAAARHGLKACKRPGPRARKIIDNIVTKRKRGQS